MERRQIGTAWTMPRRGLAAAGLLAAGWIGTAQAQTATRPRARSTGSTAPRRCASRPCRASCRISRRTSPAASGRGRRSSSPATSPRCSTPSSSTSRAPMAARCSTCRATRSTSPSRSARRRSGRWSIGFTQPFFIHPYGCLAKKGFDPKTWDDINKPEIRIVCDLGSLHETAARRYRPEGADHRATRPATRRRWPSSPAAPTCSSWRRCSACPRSPATGSWGRTTCSTGPLVALAELLRRAARARHALRRRRQRLDRLQPRRRPDPRLAAGRPGAERRVPRTTCRRR